MKIEPGMAVVLAAMVLFYLRLAWLRGRKKRLAREADLEYKRARSRGKKVEPPPLLGKDIPMYQVASWWLVGIGAFLMLAGLALRTMPGVFPAEIGAYWWVAATAGVGVFAFSLK
jgi:hypothetical protein